MVGVLVMPIFVCGHVQYIYTKYVIMSLTSGRTFILVLLKTCIHELLDSKMLARYKNTIKLIWEVGGIGEEGVVIPSLYLDVL